MDTLLTYQFVTYITRTSQTELKLKNAIRIDDTIGVIKLKIALELGISHEEIYLFGLREIVSSPTSQTIYQNVTQNGTLQFSGNRLNNYLSNFQPMTILPEDSAPETLHDTKFEFNTELVALSQKMIINNTGYPFPINPFLFKDNDPILQDTKNTISTLNNQLLLVFGRVDKICFVTAQDALEMNSALYFPLLHQDNITTFSQLADARHKLVEQTKDLVTKLPLKVIDYFYDNISTTQPKTAGITQFAFTIYPETVMKFSLEVIFKKVHANTQFPCVKFYPTRENLYRFFCERVTADNRKIPVLPKSKIERISREIGKKANSISFVGENVVVEIVEDGFFRVYTMDKMMVPVSVDTVDDIVRDALEPILNQLRPFFQQHGYNLFEFTTIRDAQVDWLTYATTYDVSKKLNFDKIMGCLAPFFVAESKTTKATTTMRYRRTSNYNHYNAINGFVIDQIAQKHDNFEIIAAMIANFGISEVEATEKYLAVINQLQVQRDAGKKRLPTIKNNPGFKSEFFVDSTKSELVVTIDGINHLGYLLVFPTYLNKITELLQAGTIPAICNKSKKIAAAIESEAPKEPEIVMEFSEIIGMSEETFGDNVTSVVDETGEIVQLNDDQNLENMEDLLDMMNFAEEEEEPTVGGASSPKTENDILPTPTIVEMTEVPEGHGRSDKNERSEFLETDEEMPVLEEDVPRELTNPLPNDIESSGLLATQNPSSAAAQGASAPENAIQDVEADSDQPTANEVRDITGMRITHPNPIQKRIEDRFPELFMVEKDEKMSLYSRRCPASERRQPVVLNETERARVIRETNADPEKDFIEYGVDPQDSEKKLYYTCPRYWCLLTNRVVTEKDILEGKCGPAVSRVEDAVIPRDAKVVPRGKYVYQFYDEKEKHYPGFHKGLTNRGLCMPCCFKTFGENEQKRKCQAQAFVKEGTSLKPSVAASLAPAETIGIYIKGADKYPLEERRWGILPPEIQFFLKENNVDCQVSKTDTTIKTNYPCMLRYGVEANAYQSFVACIASALFVDAPSELARRLRQTDVSSSNVKITQESASSVPRISEMRKILSNAVSEETFHNLQNGNLVKQFETLTNFQQFLADDKIFIDYTYLWDLVCTPNPLLFETGLNLFVLEIPRNDTTTKVQFVCPTNHYSSQVYDPKRPTLILVRQDNYFEPVYVYKNVDRKRIVITKFFTETNYPSFKALVVNVVRPVLAHKCGVFASMPNVYKFQHPPALMDLVEYLLKEKYEILQQGVGRDGRVIGLEIESGGGLRGFVPCYPTPPLGVYSTIEVEDMQNQSYEKTVKFLSRFYLDFFEGKLNKLRRVIDENVIIGIMTPTNQFVPIDPPLPVSDAPADDLTSEVMDDPQHADGTTIGLDNDRVEFMQNIKRESESYNSFRNLVRVLLAKYENSALKKALQQESQQKQIMYPQQIEKMVDLLVELVGEHAKFVSGYQMSTCNIGDNECNVFLPKQNLINPAIDNETVYFEKMADELVRYTRIKNFIFQPKQYLLFSPIKYSINDNEIIMLQSLLTQDYFDSLIPVAVNKYVRHTAFDVAMPQISQPYVGELDLEVAGETVCEPTVSAAENPALVECLSGANVEILTHQTCIDTLLNFITNKNISSGDLAEIYRDILTDKNRDNYLNWQMALGAQAAKMVLDGVIGMDDYFAHAEFRWTALDVMAVLQHYKMSYIFFFDKPVFWDKPIVSQKFDGDYVIINVPPMKKSVATAFGVAVNSEKKLLHMQDLPCAATTQLSLAQILKTKIKTNKIVWLDTEEENAVRGLKGVRRRCPKQTRFDSKLGRCVPVGEVIEEVPHMAPVEPLVEPPVEPEIVAEKPAEQPTEIVPTVVAVEAPPVGVGKKEKMPRCPVGKKEKMPRCPVGFIRDKKSGICLPKHGAVVTEPPIIEPPIELTKTPEKFTAHEPQIAVEVPAIVAEPPKKLPPCVRGTRRNKKTGNCEPTQKKETSPVVPPTNIVNVATFVPEDVIVSEQQIPKTQEKMVGENVPRKRCPKKTRRNKNGICVEKS